MGRDSIAVESCLSGESRMLDVGHGLRRWCTDPAPSVRHDRPPGHRSDGR